MRRPPRPARQRGAGKSSSDRDRRVRLNFKAASWSRVIKRVAKHGGLTVVMKKSPPGSFTRSDLNLYTVAEAIWVLNRDLEPAGYRLVRQGNFLMLLDMDALRSDYRPSVARRLPRDDAPKVQPVSGQQSTAGGSAVEPALLSSVAPETARVGRECERKGGRQRRRRKGRGRDCHAENPPRLLFDPVDQGAAQGGPGERLDPGHETMPVRGAEPSRFQKIHRARGDCVPQPRAGRHEFPAHPPGQVPDCALHRGPSGRIRPARRARSTNSGTASGRDVRRSVDGRPPDELGHSPDVGSDGRSRGSSWQRARQSALRIRRRASWQLTPRAGAHAVGLGRLADFPGGPRRRPTKTGAAFGGILGAGHAIDGLRATARHRGGPGADAVRGAQRPVGIADCRPARFAELSSL